MTLVVLGMFLIMMVATAGLISRQFRQIAVQEQEEQAFQIAEAGVNYAVWLMDNNLVDYDSPQPIQNYAVTDETQAPPEVLGTFDLNFNVLSYVGQTGPAAVRVVSVGKDAVLLQQTQIIEAVIQSDNLDTFRIVEWDHKP